MLRNMRILLQILSYHKNVWIQQSKGDKDGA